MLCASDCLCVIQNNPFVFFQSKPPPPPPTSFPKAPMGGPGMGPPLVGGPGAGPPVNMFSRRAGMWPTWLSLFSKWCSWLASKCLGCVFQVLKVGTWMCWIPVVGVLNPLPAYHPPLTCSPRWHPWPCPPISSPPLQVCALNTEIVFSSSVFWI